MPKECREQNTEDLSDAELGSLLAWLNGYNPRDKITRQTFYKRRKAIKDKTGYDIGSEEIPTKEDQETEFKTHSAKMPDNYELPFSKKETQLKAVK